MSRSLVLPGLGRLLAAVALTSLLATAAGATPATVFRTFEPSAVPPPPRDGHLARVLDVYVTLDSVGATSSALDQSQFDRFAAAVWGHLIMRLREEPGITVAPAQRDRLVRWLASREPGGKSVEPHQPSDEDLAFAERVLAKWKVDSLLYSRYGGRVVYQQLAPMQPLGAYWAFLREMEQRRVLQIRDRELRRRFLLPFSPASFQFDVPAGKVDFSRPWWESASAGVEAHAQGVEASSQSDVEGAEAGYTLLEDRVRFVFDPTRFRSVTDGGTGAWMSLSDLRIHTVCVAGDFNGWSTTAWLMRPVGPTGSIQVLERSASQLGGSGRHEFKFVVDGQWWVEPPPGMRNRAATNLGNDGGNIVLQLP